ncbi:DUF1801 domain-containing protein [uncultured Chitinophaga sp.]|uniref:DUF1801 domain-containing protein n=1 Tax=uncultured Chitinophaga sp. TaxID=339340 RepID=UPI0025F4B838|nr:DUF1801 domain-containing protein [uncultured Chitinophaga sp.]
MASKNVTVPEYMERLEHPLKKEVEALRQIILEANDKLEERVKWNSPSFFYKNIDMAAFHLRPDEYVHIVFVFPDGKMLKDNYGFLDGDYKDRRLAKFYNMDEINERKTKLQQLVNDWITLVDNA